MRHLKNVKKPSWPNTQRYMSNYTHLLTRQKKLRTLKTLQKEASKRKKLDSHQRLTRRSESSNYIVEAKK